MIEAFGDITELTGFAIRLCIAIILGLIIGFERQWNKHQAGIMTNVIVCVGSFAFTAFSFLAFNYEGVDITRVASGIVSGIGFLGAGVILREEGNIRGLSTAATIWATAAVGILCTLENVFFAVIVAVAIVFLHLVLHPFADYVNKKSHYNKDLENKRNIECLYKLSITCTEETEIDIRAHLVKTIKTKDGILLHNLESKATDEGNVKIRAYVTTMKKDNEIVENLLIHIGKDPGIISAGWNLQ
ncbi:MAG: MgtC/SapB family protein [Eubacterium sp.]|nr:MgtC/SapB family protein [Eubacterium sp.]